jgi:hypothetical protein
VSARTEALLTKRCTWIQKHTAKFTATYDKMKRLTVSGLGVADLMTQSLDQFKVANEQKYFNLVQSWTTLNDCPKWHELYVSYDTNVPDESNLIYVDDKVRTAPMKKPRGRMSS